MKVRFLGFTAVTDRLAAGVDWALNQVTLFKSVILLVLIDAVLMVYREFYGADWRAIFYHAMIGATLLLFYYKAFVHRNLNRSADLPKEPTDFWLLTLLLPSFVGFALYEILWRTGLQTFASEWEVFKHGVLIGEIYFIPLVGLLVGWKFIRAWSKTKF